jgi:hypothetical protein
LRTSFAVDLVLVDPEMVSTTSSCLQVASLPKAINQQESYRLFFITSMIKLHLETYHLPPSSFDQLKTLLKSI